MICLKLNAHDLFKVNERLDQYQTCINWYKNVLAFKHLKICCKLNKSQLYDVNQRGDLFVWQQVHVSQSYIISSLYYPHSKNEPCH